MPYQIPKSPADLARQLALMYGVDAKLEARDEIARAKEEAGAAHSAAVQRKKTIYDSTDNASLEKAKATRAAAHVRCAKLARCLTPCAGNQA